MQENIILKRLSGLKCFPAFGNPMKRDAGVFYISSSEKEITVPLRYTLTAQMRFIHIYAYDYTHIHV